MNYEDQLKEFWPPGKKEKTMTTKKPTWCEHIVWADAREASGTSTKWEAGFYIGFSFVPDSWTLCPICGAKRPTKEKE